MRRAIRTCASGVLAALLAAGTQPAAAAQEPDEGLAPGTSTAIDLPDGGSATFTPTDDAAAGAAVVVERIAVEGATATTDDGEVTTLSDGISVTATNPAGEDLSSFEHSVTIEQGDQDAPAYDLVVPGVSLEFPVDPEDLAGIDPATLGVWARDDAGDEWQWVPSTYDSDRGVVIAEADHLSDFVVMGAPAATPDPELPRIALDPDNDVGQALWNGAIEGELAYSHAVAQAVKAQLEATCGAEVLVTRNASTRFVSRSIRAGRMTNFDPDIALTLAFNIGNTNPATGIGEPWGIRTDGGVVAWANSNSASTTFGNRFRANIPGYTGRPSRQPLNPSFAPHLPYSEFAGIAPAYAHAELLFLDHNYDHVVLDRHLDWVVNAVYASIIEQIEATPGIACVEPVTLPQPPSAEELERVRQLGYNNYQRYGTDPVNLATGNFVASEEVFTLTGVGDQVIDLTLAYNALDGRASPVGNGWNFAYSSRAQLYDSGAVMVVLADGRSVFFESDGEAGFTSPPTARTSLTAVEGGVALKLADNTVLEFAVDEESGYGSLTRAVDRQGNAYTLSYGDLAEAEEDEIVFAPLQSITDEAGQVVTVTATATGRITAFTHPDGRRWALGYDAAGNLTSVTDGAGRTRAFSYTAAGLLETVTGADGVNELTNVYDDEQRVVTQTDGAGYTRTISYDDAGTTTLTDALGNATVLVHNDAGQLVQELDPEGGTTVTGYDPNSQPVLSRDATGNEHRSTFDSYGRVLTYTNPLGETTRYSYNSRGDLISISSADPNGGTAMTRFTLNEDGRAVETHLPDGTVTYATFDAHGDPLSITDGEGNVTTFAYDERGNRIRTTDPLGNVTTRAYDLANRVTSSADALGGVTVFAYDAADNLVRTVDALGGVSTYTYDVNDSLVSETDENGDVTTYEYNVNLQLVAVNRPDGNREEYVYDAEHRLVEQHNADGATRSWEYDRLGRITAMVDEAGERWLTEYDAIGNQVARIDPTGARTETAFDALSRPVTVTDAAGGVSTYTYNPAGLVASQSDELGRTVRFGYDSLGRLTTVTTPDGETNTFTYDDDGRVRSVTDALGRTETYEVDALGRTVRITDAAGGTWLTEYDALGNVVATADPLGGRSETEFDALSRAVAVTDPLGGRREYAYDAVGSLTSLTNALGQTTTYEHDALGRTTRTTYADGAVETFTYDEIGRLVRTQDVRGEVVSREYDARGLLTAVVDEAGERWLTEYDARGLAVATVDPLGGRATVTYDALGRPVATVDEAGARTEQVYDAAGQVIERVNAVGDVTRYDYDVMGRLLTVTSPQGATTVYGYDAVGNKTALTNPLGDTITHTYDDLDRVVATVYPDGGRETTQYDAVGNVIAARDPRGGTTEYGYDALGRQVTMVDPAGFTTEYAYDLVGNLLSVTDARGGTWSYTYDQRGRLVGQVGPEGETTSYERDPAGNVVKVTHPAGVVSRRMLDARGMLIASVENYRLTAIPSADVNVATAIERDAVGRTIATTDPRGNTTTYRLDALGRVVAETDPLGQTSTVAYDALGRPVLATAPDGTETATSYTPDGFVEHVAYADQTVAFGYDALGNRTSMTDDLGTSTWTYDWAGRVLSETDATGATNTYAYDVTGNQVRVEYPDTRVVERSYDARNLPVSQTDATGVTQFAYDGAGDLVGIDRASGVATAIERDLAGRVASIVHSGETATGIPLPSGEVNPSSMAPGNAYGHCKQNGNGHPHQQPAGCDTTVLGFSYDYDARGLIEVREVASDAAVTRTEYTHDPLGRLTASVTGGATYAYGWDAASNLVSEAASDDLSTEAVGDGYAVIRTVDEANRLVQSVRDPHNRPDSHTRTTTYGYDGRGNRVSETVTRVTGNKTQVLSRVEYDFDARDLLVERTGGDEADLTYTRDGLGRALSLTEDGAVRARLYDGLAVVRDGATALTRMPGGAVLAESTEVTVGNGRNARTRVEHREVLTDVLGSPVATATDGVIDADLALFGDFGEAWTEPDAPSVTGFTGQVEVAGLVEFTTRTYDVDSRVWLSDDAYRGTVTRTASLNRYAYVEGAPESYTDVLGFFRAAAALRAQQLAAYEAALRAAELAAYKAAPVCSGIGCLYEAQRRQAKLDMPPWVAGYNYVLAVQAYQDYQERLAVYREENYSYARSGTTREREAERIYQERMRIHHQWVAEQTQVAAERDSLLLYHTATQTADVLSDPSMAAHTVLDVVGMIPAIGEAADLLNAAIYAAEGNHLDAGLSLAGAIPFAGAAVTAVRTVRNAVRAADVATTAARLADTVRVVDSIPTRAATPPTPDLTAPRVPDTPGTTPSPPDTQPATRTEPPGAGAGSGTPRPAAETGVQVSRTGGGTANRPGISLDEARAAAERNGIDTRLMDLNYDAGAPGQYGYTSFTGSGQPIRGSSGRFQTTLTDLGLRSEPDAVNTIAHELNHLREALATGSLPTGEGPANLAGDLAELFFR